MDKQKNKITNMEENQLIPKKTIGKALTTVKKVKIKDMLTPFNNSTQEYPLA